MGGRWLRPFEPYVHVSPVGKFWAFAHKKFWLQPSTKYELPPEVVLWCLAHKYEPVIVRKVLYSRGTRLNVRSLEHDYRRQVKPDE
jgi:hypothetical protein